MIALSRRDQRARMFLERAVTLGVDVVIPAVVVAETVRGKGPRDAAVERVLADANELSPVTAATARIAGRELGRTRSSSTIDALVVASAIERGGARVLTSDPEDLRALTPRGSGVQIHGL